MLDQYNDILTVSEFAEILRIGTTHAYRILNSGRICAYKEGKDWKIPKESVKNYIIENTKLK